MGGVKLIAIETKCFDLVLDYEGKFLGFMSSRGAKALSNPYYWAEMHPFGCCPLKRVKLCSLHLLSDTLEMAKSCRFYVVIIKEEDL